MATATNQKRVLLAVGGILAVAALVLGVVLASDDGDEDGGDTTTTTAATSTTEGSSTTEAPTSTAAAPAPEDVDAAAFPDLTSGARFSDPVALVEAFATQVLGFDTDLEVGAYQAGDPRSGEVVVHPATETGQGPATTVAVRQISDDSWVVVTAFTDTIQVVEPEQGLPISSPQALRGSAAAFEGHVDVLLYADGSPSPIATTFVTGRGDGVLGEFDDELTFEAPDGATHGVLVLSEPSAQDGTTWAATALRVRFSE